MKINVFVTTKIELKEFLNLFLRSIKTLKKKLKFEITTSI